MKIKEVDFNMHGKAIAIQAASTTRNIVEKSLVPTLLSRLSPRYAGKDSLGFMSVKRVKKCEFEK